MFKKISFKMCLTIICLSIIIPIKANANDYTLNDLVEKGKLLDGRELILKGEAVGENIKRGDYSWININDTTNAMGIYMTKDDSLKVKNYGGYNKRGDILEVVGTFNKACKEHGGDMDVHAKKILIIEKGKMINNKLPKEKVILAIIMPVLTLAMGYFLYKRNNIK